MAHPWEVVAPEVTGLVTPVPLDKSGNAGPTRGQSRGPRWRQTTTGWHVPASVSDEAVEQRILEQSMRLTGTGAVTAWASLRLHRGNFFDGFGRDGRTRLPMPLAAGKDRLSPHTDIWLTRDGLDEAEVVVRRGIRCTTPHRALFDEMRRTGDERDAVVAADMAFAAKLTGPTAFASYVEGRPGRRGVPLVRRALELADEGSRSPAESRLRLIWVFDAGWSRPLCNRAVFDLDGTFLGIPDLLDFRRGIIGEFDGADHRSRERHRHDVHREDMFRRVGLEYFTVVGSDLYEPELVVKRMEETAARAGRDPQRWKVRGRVS